MLRPRSVALRATFAAAALGGLALALPSDSASWTQALVLVWNSNVIAALVLVAWMSVRALVGATQRRAISPGMPMLACATVGSLDGLLAHRLLIAQVGHPGRSKVRDSGGGKHWSTALLPCTAALWLTRSVVVVLLSIGAVVVIGVTGHLPGAGTANGTAVVMATVWLALVGTLWGLHVRRRVRDSPVTMLMRVVLARRGPHALVVAGAGEIALGLMVALMAAILTHTDGGPAPGVLEVLAIAVLARLFTIVPAPPFGLGLADGVLIFGLILIGVPTEVAMATTLAWRVTGLVVMAVGFLAARSHRPDVESAGQVAAAPTDSTLGRCVHRAGFALLAWLPRGLASAARRRLFDAMFALADDPWDYALMPYEQRKQAHLTAVIPSGADVIVEIGCADGHNIAEWSQLHPESKVIGIDISERAIATATRRIHNRANATVVRADAKSIAEVLDEYRGQVDVLVLSEVLYYLGTGPQVRQALMASRALLSPDATVVLVHGAYDAQRLHAPACAALGVILRAETLFADPERPYVVTVALGAVNGSSPRGQKRKMLIRKVEQCPAPANGPPRP